MIVLLNAGLKETSSYLWFFVVKKNFVFGQQTQENYQKYTLKNNLS